MRVNPKEAAFEAWVQSCRRHPDGSFSVHFEPSQGERSAFLSGYEAATQDQQVFIDGLGAVIESLEWVILRVNGVDLPARCLVCGNLQTQGHRSHTDQQMACEVGMALSGVVALPKPHVDVTHRASLRSDLATWDLLEDPEITKLFKPSENSEPMIGFFDGPIGPGFKDKV